MMPNGFGRMSSSTSKLYNLKLNWYNIGIIWRDFAFLLTIRSMEKNLHEEDLS